MTRIAVVTGGNQGLGLALVRGLAREWGEDGIVYLTARSRERGEAAVASLVAEGLRPRFEELDVSDDASVAALAEVLRERHGGVDVVLSNAAHRISRELSDADQVRPFVNVNNLGTDRMLRAFGPLLRDGGRFVVVASSFGSLLRLPEPLRPRFAGAGLAEVQTVLGEWVDLVEAGRAAEAGWPDWINIPSKVGQVASVRAYAAELGEQAAERDLLVTAACPGLVDTDASRPWFADMSQAKSPDEAAVDVLWLATLPAQDRARHHAELVRYRVVLP